ncbi:MAG: IS3 family transposase, partial [Planctomycetota bacterium]
MIAVKTYSRRAVSIRRLAKAADEPVSTVGRWVGAVKKRSRKPRCRPVAGDPQARAKVYAVCHEHRNRTFGYRRIWALLRRRGVIINKKTVWKIMHDLGL